MSSRAAVVGSLAADVLSCREEQESYWANRVDDALGTHELGARARHLTTFLKGKEKTLQENTPELIPTPFSWPVFPQEIFDIIITYLSDYPRALIRLILVSKRWVPLCRRLLYSSLDFSLEDDFHKKCPYPHFVRRMSLICKYGYLDLAWIQPIIRNMEKFTSLDHLELVDFPWHVLWLNSRTALLNAPLMRQVNKVFLGGVEVEALNHIAISISRGFPGLKELVILMEIFEDEDGDEQSELSDLPSPLVIPGGLSELTIQDHPLYPTPSRFWWNWFIEMKFTGLRSITLGDLLGGDIPLFKAFVDIAGRSLSHLEVGIATANDLSSFTIHRTLSSCPNLESLIVTQPVRTMNEEWACEKSVECFRHLFSSFTAERLRIISLPVVKRWAMEVERGVRVEGVLTTDRFPLLEVLEFCSDIGVDFPT